MSKKIVGATVGTPIKPQKVVEKAKVDAVHVYVGSDTPPENATIWIDPTGEPTSTEEWEFDMDDGTTEKKTVVVVS